MTVERCLFCGHKAVSEHVIPYRVEHNGKAVEVQDRTTVCSNCNKMSYVGSQVSEHERVVAAAVRKMDGLLSAEELRVIRVKYGFKQSDMEQMLSTGPKTWTRWERGKVPQSKAADTLIRLIANDPYVAQRLMEQAGVSNADATSIFEQIKLDEKVVARSRLRQELRDQSNCIVEEVVDQVADRIIEAMCSIRWKEAQAA